jgi:ketosteroid isomerase-like protein
MAQWLRLIVVLTVLIASAAVGVRAAQPPGTEAELRALEEKLARAWVEKDRVFIEGLLAADWSVTDAAGQVLTKEQVLIQTFASSERTIDSMAIDDVRVRVFGSTAVVTGRTRATGSYRGQTGSAVLRFTDVFAQRDGRWQIVASHGSAVTP